MPTFEDLRLKLGQLISSEWYDRLVDHLTNIAFRGAVTYYGDIYTDLKPHPDLALNLGMPDLRFLAVYAGYGYFDYGIYPPPPAVWEGGAVKKDVYPETDLTLNLGLPDLRFKALYAGYGRFVYNVWIGVKKVEQLIEEKAPPWYGGVIKYDTYPETDLAINLGFPNLRFKQVHAGYGYLQQLYADYSRIEELDVSRVKSHLTPISDLALNLGLTNLRWLQVHAYRGYFGYGDFAYDLYARGYRVLTEADPITIERDLTREPILLGQKFNYLAPDFVDVFDTDLAIQRTGRVRAQFTLQSEAISYLKVVPAGTAYEIISALAGASYISPYAWHEFDLTVQKDDGVNVRFSPSTIVSIRIYNIGST